MSMIDHNGDITLVGGLSITTCAILLIAGMIFLGMWGCPMYNVYRARKQGEAVLAHAQSSREVAVAEAKAKMESSILLAKADSIRAGGIAAANKIIGQSLANNPDYLKWLWIDELKDSKNQIIYVPSGQLGLPITEAGRAADK
jgi:regulator of protease activity HflC (stomatin/prohibitin superfamily)